MFNQINHVKVHYKISNAFHFQAPPRADVVKGLKNGIILNLLGMGSAILGMQATVGLLVAKALTSSANPYYQGTPPGTSPVLALDVFLVQVIISPMIHLCAFPHQGSFYIDLDLPQLIYELFFKLQILIYIQAFLREKESWTNCCILFISWSMFKVSRRNLSP